MLKRVQLEVSFMNAIFDLNFYLPKCFLISGDKTQEIRVSPYRLATHLSMVRRESSFSQWRYYIF